MEVVARKSLALTGVPKCYQPVIVRLRLLKKSVMGQRGRRPQFDVRRADFAASEADLWGHYRSGLGDRPVLRGGHPTERQLALSGQTLPRLQGRLWVLVTPGALGRPKD